MLFPHIYDSRTPSFGQEITENPPFSMVLRDWNCRLWHYQTIFRPLRGRRVTGRPEAYPTWPCLADAGWYHPIYDFLAHQHAPEHFYFCSGRPAAHPIEL